MKQQNKGFKKSKNRFDTKEKCLAFIHKLHKAKHKCPNCKIIEKWQKNEQTYRCRKCGHRTSATSGTLFQDTPREKLPLWFQAICHITSKKDRTNALELQKELGLGSYRTAWVWLHKIRRAMFPPLHWKLHGAVEIVLYNIESWFKNKENIIIAIAVEVGFNQVGRIRVSVIEKPYTENINKFIENNVESHDRASISNLTGLHDENFELDFVGFQSKYYHRVESLLYKGLFEKMQGSFSLNHFTYYLDEFCFKFNNRNNKELLFDILLTNAIFLEPITHKDIIAKKKAPPD
jgi:predicted RNA-binding Zn-ribbon protein involved in translation (DUF1610 family)